MAVGGWWRLAVGGGWGSFRAVLNKNKFGVLKDRPEEARGRTKYDGQKEVENGRVALGDVPSGRNEGAGWYFLAYGCVHPRARMGGAWVPRWVGVEEGGFGKRCESLRGYGVPRGLLPPPPCDSPSGCCFFTGPWTVTRSSLRMLRRVATLCRPLRPVLLLVSFPRSRSPVVGVLGLC